MLSIIDRYIIKKFLSTFFFMLGVIMMFAIVFDVSEKLGEFISNEAPLSEICLLARLKVLSRKFSSLQNSLLLRGY